MLRSRYATLLDMLDARAADSPTRGFTFLDDGETEGARVTFPELARRARALAAPFAVLRVTAADLFDGALALDLFATTARVLTGTLLAIVCGLVVGVGLGARPLALRVVGPWVDGVRSVPPVLVYPLCLLALGYSETSRVATIAFGAFGVVVLPVAQAVASTARERRDAARLAGMSGLDLVWRLYVPEAAPALATGVRLALSQALIVAVVTEMLVSPPRGLGVRALTALQEYRTERLWQVMLTAGALAMSLNTVVRAVERRVHRRDDAAT